jgi:hypothetical protein
MATVLTQWSSSVPFAGTPVSWAPAEDIERLNSYTVYESIYWNVPDAFKVVQRGSDSKPIYIPAAKQIIETIHRYLAPRMSIICDPLLGTPEQRTAAMLWWTVFARRERFFSKFNSNKRYGLIRGDWLFHLTGDEEREEGSRISFETIDPAEYFPIYNEDDQITIIGCHLIAVMEDENGDQVMYRQTYRKVTGLGGPSQITVEEALYELDEWGQPGSDNENPTPITVIRPPTALPDAITAIPVYQIPNIEEPGSIWGSSELRGIERLLTAINQSISDEELELVLNGLGVYVTDAGSPIDEDTGEPIPWNLGPAKVVELPEGKKFTRVDATKSVTPHQEHLKYLHSQLDASTGNNDVAGGRADVATAESGIALLIKLAPLFAICEEKELIITDVMTQMLWDLRAFASAYEGVNLDAIAFIPKYGDRLPLNADKRFEQLMLLFEASVISMGYLLKELAKLGWVFEGDALAMIAEIVAEKAALSAGGVSGDPIGDRQQQELDDAGV